MTIDNQKLAVLIDADNAQPKIVKGLFNEIAQYGTAIVRRIYGDWTTPNLGSWREHLSSYAIQPIQQFRYTTGKNATDSALIIDAMDLLHNGGLDGFCIISSDSDFTKLAMRIRESGLKVYGFGEKKTPEAFINACDKFVFIEVFRDKEEEPDSTEETADSAETTPDNIEEAGEIISHAIQQISTEEGSWVPLAAIGSYISKNHPSFDARNYGFSKMGQLAQSLDNIEVQLRTSPNNPNTRDYYVRLKNTPEPSNED